MSVKLKLPTIEIGVSYSAAYTWSTEEADGSHTPVDLTGWEGILQFKTSEAAADLYLEVSTTNGRLTLSGNLIQIEVPTSVTKNLAAIDDGVHDLLLWPSGVGGKEQAIRLFYGEFSAVKTVSSIPV